MAFLLFDGLTETLGASPDYNDLYFIMLIASILITGMRELDDWLKRKGQA